MPAIQLTPAQRKDKRADAHHLDPVVMIGGEGLTPAVVKETDAALKSHGLIKVRVLGDDRDAREAMFAQLCDELNAAPIQHIGKLLCCGDPFPRRPRPSVKMRAPARVSSRSSSSPRTATAARR